MTQPQVPIQTEPMVDDNKVATLPWLSFFESEAAGDVGNAWNPTFINLSSTGTPTITGVYYYLSNKLTYYRITITPSPGGDTSAVAGTTYCDNFPIPITADGGNFSVGGSGAAAAATTSGTKRIYTGTWTGATTPITIAGIAEV